MSTTKLTLGTRGSPLALAQAHEVRDKLAAIHPALSEPGAIAVEVLKTTGDNVQDRPLAEIGGKGLFTKELDDAMLDGRIDIAVHSMKDVATVLPDGIVLPAILEREDPRDAFISPKAKSYLDLPEGAVIGTASLRRGAQILCRRPDLKVVNFRGNVQTRLKKLEAGDVDATLLAVAGLNRLGMIEVATGILETDELLPAVAQGAVGVTCRADDEAALSWLAPLAHERTTVCVDAERAFLANLDGSCRTPIAGLAQWIDDASIRFRGNIVRPDGSLKLADDFTCAPDELTERAAESGARLKAQTDPSFYAFEGA